MIKKMIVSILMAIVLCFGAYIAGTLFLISQNMTTSHNALALLQTSDVDAPPIKEPEVPNTLPDDFYVMLLGVDSDENRINGDEAGEFEGAFRSDTIIVAHINLLTKKISLLSLERDIKTEIYGYGEDTTYKLNAAYLLGGEPLMREQAEELLNPNWSPTVIEIPYYAVVDMDGMMEIIDSVGGIDVDVEDAFWDPQLQEGLDQGGWQHLDGHDAVMYCRSRYAWDDGDFARGRHQRQVLQALANKLMSNSDPFALLGAAETISNHVASNMPMEQIFEVASKLRGIDTAHDIYSMMTPTNSIDIDGQSFQELSEAAWKIVLEQFIMNEDPAYAASQLDAMGIMTGGIDYTAPPEPEEPAEPQPADPVSDIEAAERAIANGVATDVTNGPNT